MRNNTIKQIDAAFKNDINLDLSVSKVLDSSYSLAKLYSAAQDHISIYTNTLREDLFGDDGVKSALSSFLSKDSSKILDIIIKDNAAIDGLENHSLMRFLAKNENFLNKVRIYKVTATPMKNCESHFSVIDSSRYRLSKLFDNIDQLPSNNSGFIGIVNAHDIETSQHLQKLFVRFRDVSQKVNTALGYAA